MELIDRRGFACGILFGTAIAAAGLPMNSETVSAMPRRPRSGRPRRVDREGSGGGHPAGSASPASPSRLALLVESRPPRLRLALGVI
jgi:hypothetical protein